MIFLRYSLPSSVILCSLTLICKFSADQTRFLNTFVCHNFILRPFLLILSPYFYLKCLFGGPDTEFRKASEQDDVTAKGVRSMVCCFLRPLDRYNKFLNLIFLSRLRNDSRNDESRDSSNVFFRINKVPSFSSFVFRFRLRFKAVAIISYLLKFHPLTYTHAHRYIKNYCYYTEGNKFQDSHLYSRSFLSAYFRPCEKVLAQNRSEMSAEPCYPISQAYIITTLLTLLWTEPNPKTRSWQRKGIEENIIFQSSALFFRGIRKEMK